MCCDQLVTVEGASLQLDPERPEYHRAILRVDAAVEKGVGVVYARSTGMQRSSRLLSMKAANALLVLPQGSPTRSVGVCIEPKII